MELCGSRFNKGILNYIFFVFALSSPALILSQEDCDDNVIFDLSDINGMVGENVCIDISVTNFTNISAFQFSINFNPNILEYTNCLNPNNLNTFTCNSIIPVSAHLGILRILWFEQNANPVSVADSTVIFQLCFNLVGDPGSSNPIAITDNPVEIEIVFEDDDGMSGRTDSICQTGGNVSVDCSAFSVSFSTCATLANVREGSIKFSACGGTPPYQYNFNSVTGTLNGDNEEFSFTDLFSGSYTLFITDDTGEVLVESVDIPEGDPLALDLDAVVPSCAVQRFPNGRITAQPSGGLAPYYYTWSTTPSNVQSINQLENGEYSVTVEDSYGCIIDSTITLLKDTLQVEATIIDSAICDGPDNVRGGRLLFKPSGGTQFNGFGYNICATFENGQNICTGQPDTSLFIINIPAGIISYRVIDGSQPVNQCTTATKFIEMPFKKTLSLDINAQDISCFGQIDGESLISVSSIGSVAEDAPFTYELNDIDGNFIGGVNTSIPFYEFNQLEADSFVINVKDGDGCVTNDTFAIREPMQLSIDTVEFNQPGCASNGSDGSITVAGAGGTGNLLYSWNDGESGASRIDLPEGNFKVTVSDENNCQDSLNFDLSIVGAIGIEAISISAVECAGDENGSISIRLPANSDPGITFDWGQGPGTDTLRTNLGAGDYPLRIANDAGCFIDTVLTVQGPVPLTFEAAPDPPLCPGSLGNLGIIVSGGTGSYHYSWVGYPDTTALLPQVPAGNYNVLVSDDNNCSETFNLVLEDPEKIDLQVDQVTDVICSGQSDGSAEATASGGTDTLGIYLYTWSSGESQIGVTSQSDSLFSGQQWVIASDGICASDTIFFDVLGPDSIDIDMNNTLVQQPGCFGMADGSITIEAMGGTAPYNYTWIESGSTSQTLNNIESGWHSVNIIDQNSCSVIDSIFIDQPDTLYAFIDSSGTLNLNCFADEVGQISVDHSGGNTGTFSYQWNNGVSSTTNLATSLGAGLYVVTVTDNNGCSATVEYEITSQDSITADIPIPENPACFGGQTCIGVNSASGGSGPNFRFSINNGPLFNIDTCIQVFAGSYTVKVFDRDGCSMETSFTIDQPSEFIVELGPDIEIDLGGSGQITAQVPSDMIIDSVFWNPIDSIQCLTADCSSASFSPTNDTRYQVVVKDILGCTAVDEVMVRVKRSRNVFIPNVFRPTNANTNSNNSFKVFAGAGATLVEYIRIFDRWGNLMYLEENLNPSATGAGEWDGTYKGELLDPGVFVYAVKVLFADGQNLIYKGSVTLLK